MKISEVKTAAKVGDFILKENHRNKIDIKFLPTITKDVLNDSVARIYLFVVDGIIKKIGGSSSKGGIKSTMNFYASAMTGSPGVPRFVIHLLLAEALKKESKVELYMITSPKVLATVNGLFRFRLTGDAGRNYAIQGATDSSLSNWSTLTNAFNPYGTIWLTNPMPQTQLFFRALSLP